MPSNENSKEKNVLIVKLTPVEKLDSSVMRMIGIVKGFQENGYKVTILGVPFSGVQTHELQECLKNSCIVRTGSPSTTLYSKMTSDNKKKSLKKYIKNICLSMAHFFFPYDNTYSYLKSIDLKLLPEKKYDVVVSVSDPKTSHLAVKRLIKQGLQYSKWIEYWGDPYTFDITSTLKYPTFIKKKIELHLMNKSDRVIYVSPLTLEKQKDEFKQKSQIMGCCVPPYLNVRNTYVDKKRAEFKVGYFGSYMKVARNIVPFYEACCEMKDIDCTIVGNGDIELNSKSNIKVMPRGEVQELEDDMDLIICILNHSGTQIPGKLYHDASTNKAILVIVDGENGEKIKKFLGSFNRYYFCKNDKDEIMKKIIEIKSNPQEWYPCKEFESKRIVKQMLEEL